MLACFITGIINNGKLQNIFLFSSNLEVFLYEKNMSTMLPVDYFIYLLLYLLVLFPQVSSCLDVLQDQLMNVKLSFSFSN